MESSDRRLKEIFAGALDIAAGPGRSAYVERECLGDASLRDRVEALLEAHEKAGRFLAPAADTGAPGDESPRPETTAAELSEPSGSRPEPRMTDPLAATVAVVPCSASSSDRPAHPPSRIRLGHVGPYKLLEQIGGGEWAPSTWPSRSGRSVGVWPSRSSSRGWTPIRSSPLRGRASGPGADGPPEHCSRPGGGPDRFWAALLRDGTGQREPHHAVLR